MVGFDKYFVCCIEKMTKEELRVLFKNQLRFRTCKSWGAVDLSISENISKKFWFARAGQIGMFASTPWEPKVNALYEYLAKRRKRVYLPRIVNNASLAFFSISTEAPMVLNRFGIAEPLGGGLWKPKPSDIIVVPGLCFDLLGYRVGYGRGYYDRYLKKLSLYVLRVGIAYDYQVVGSIIKDPWDQPMDLVVTEKREIICPSFKTKMATRSY